LFICVSRRLTTAYCLDIHTRDLIRKGVKIEQLALVQAWAEAGHLFNERERAALAWTEVVTRVSETGVPDAAFQAARAAFDEKELVDLTIAISLMNAYTSFKLNRSGDRGGACRSFHHHRMVVFARHGDVLQQQDERNHNKRNCRSGICRAFLLISRASVPHSNLCRNSFGSGWKHRSGP
jgi:Carboxymuconolactone decarboxylase family